MICLNSMMDDSHRLTILHLIFETDPRIRDAVAPLVQHVWKSDYYEARLDETSSDALDDWIG